MENTARLFNCVRCHRQVLICRHCDRGNIYCDTPCSQTARRESLRAAGRRYQRARQGRICHAGRQRRYRSRAQKVTHQGSTTSPAHDSLTPELRIACARRGSSPAVRAQGLYCHFCHRPCAPRLRLDFLRNSGPRGKPPDRGWPLDR